MKRIHPGRPGSESSASSPTRPPSPPEELDGSPALIGEEPETFGRSLAALHEELGLKILGGCCGTDDRHIRCLAARLASYPDSPAIRFA